MITRFVKPTAESLKLRSRPVVAPQTDTGKRFLAGQVAPSFGESFDGEWRFVDAPAGSGWASAQYLEEVPETVAPAAPVAVSSVIPGTTTARLLYSLEGEDPAYTAAIEKLRAKALLEGIEFGVADFGGVRSEADTIKILKYRDDDYAVYLRNFKPTRQQPNPTPKATWRPINKFGTSMHNFGFARDLKITKYPSSFTKDLALARLGKLAPSFGLRWGGTFQRYDGPHFELAISLAEAKRRYEARQ